MKKRNLPPTKKAIIDPQVGKTVWVSCRAAQNCSGNWCEIRRVFKLPAGGKSIHYHCPTCKRGFVITF